LAAPMLEVNDVYKSFAGQPVLSGVSLTVERGSVVCLIGPSGSGKSTLLRCINHLETVDAGRILVDGRLVGYEEVNGVLYELPPREVATRRADIGMVFQQFNLFGNMTALENVMVGLIAVRGLSRERARARAVELLDRVGLGSRMSHRPHQLSGGQQQRVAIARALAMDPKLLLFDEPTSALDPELVGEVLEVIRAVAADGMTMVVVTHEMSFARDVATSVIFMDGGVVIEQGSPDLVLVSPEHARTREFLRRIIRADERPGSI